jgi:hypothetical protein
MWRGGATNLKISKSVRKLIQIFSRLLVKTNFKLYVNKSISVTGCGDP